MVDERRLLGDEVHPVEDRVDEDHVELLVRSDRLRKVVAGVQIDRQPGVGAEAVVHERDLPLDRLEVAHVLRQRLP